MFKFLRAFPGMRRPNSHSSLSLLNQSGPVNIQRVRILRRTLTRKRVRRILLAVAITGVFYKSLLDLVDEDDEENDASRLNGKHSTRKLVEKAKKEKHSAQAVQDTVSTQDVSYNEYLNGVRDGDGNENGIPDTLPEDALFIPLSSPRRRPTTFYKGTDPEWQSFIRFSEDSEKCQYIRNELAYLVVFHLASLHNFQKQLGMPIVPRRFWLDFDFPNSPPPEYERDGIEITDDYVAFTTRPISSAQHSRLQAILQPLPMLSALWASYRLMWTLQVARIKRFLNFDPKQDGSNTNGSTHFFNLRHFANRSQKQESHLSPKTKGLSESQAAHSAEEIEDISDEEPASYSDEEELPRKLEGSIFSKDAQTLSIGDDMRAALKAFERTLAKKWRQPGAVSERGSVYVSGMVEMLGSRAVCVADVRATYIPRESRWVAVGIDIRRIQLRKQSPRGK